MLKYIGNGAAIPGIPARDLTAEEVEKYLKPVIKKSGLDYDEWIAGNTLYKPIKKTKKKASGGE